MPLKAALQLEGQEDLRYGGGGHLAPAHQFVNRGGYRPEGFQHLAGVATRPILPFPAKGLGRGGRAAQNIQNIVGVAHQYGPIPDKAI